MRDSIRNENFKHIAYCGVDCSVCVDFKEGKCPNCRDTVWTDEDICPAVDCCRKKNLSCCGECDTFPCANMEEFYQESESHKKALELMRSVQKKER